MLDRGLRPVIFETKSATHVQQVLSGFRPGRFDAVACLGGDGTNFHVLNGLIRTAGVDGLPPLGIIPLGRGNSFARDLGIFSPEAGVDAIAGARTRRVDVCRYSQGADSLYFVNLLGLGFVSDVAATAARFAAAGDLSYVIGVGLHLFRLRAARLEMEIDGRPLPGRYCFIEFCNSRYTGGKMLMAPSAEIDDGLFDAVIVAPLSPIRLAMAFPRIFRGDHLTDPSVRLIRGKTARVSADKALPLLPDGELLGRTPTRIEVIAGCAPYFCR
jgi:YegS/Rv2252/BmrU family lipid kinase